MAASDQAAAQVALKYDPQQAAIQRQIEAIAAQTAANEAGLNKYGTEGRQAIGNVYDTLGGLLAANRQQSAADIGRQADLVGTGYDQANAYSNAVANAGRARLNDLSAQLGAGPQGALKVNTDLESTLANILGQNAQARATATGNLKTWGGQWDQILGQGINIGEQSRARASSDLETELLGLLGQNRVTGLEGQNSMYGKLADIMAARQNDLINTYNELAAQEWERALKEAQLNQAAQEANARLVMQGRELDLRAAAQSSDDEFRRSQAAKGDQLSQKDLIDLWFKQQGLKSGAEQQAFENRLANSRLGLDYLQAQGESNPYPGNDYLVKLLTDPDSPYFGTDEAAGQGLADMAIRLQGLGYDNSLAEWLNSQASAASPTFNVAAGGGSSRGGPLANGLISGNTNPSLANLQTAKGSWWNPQKWVNGIGNAFRLGVR